MADGEVHVAIANRWLVGFGLAGAALGAGAAFVVGPIVNWLLGLVGDAPGPLRLVAALPLEWAIPVLTAVGGCLGVWVARQWQKENGVTAISAQGVTTERGVAGHHVARDQISGVFTDGGELVLVGASAEELLRSPTDQVLVARLRQAFEEFGYPWRGTSDPYEQDFVAWVDGRGPLEAPAHALLRERQRALDDKRDGAAADARDQLRGLGVTVRDRGGVQQYRVLLQD